MLSILCNASEGILSGRNDFWVLAALTERSLRPEVRPSSRSRICFYDESHVHPILRHKCGRESTAT